MERQFTLPIAFAAAFHGALFYGFTKPVPVITPTVIRIPFDPLPLPVEEVDPVTPEDTGPETPPSEIAPPAPSLPERLAVATEQEFTRPILPRNEVVADESMLRIPRDFGPQVQSGPGKWGNIVPTDALDNPPRTRFQPVPVYPHEAKVQGLTGDVQIEFVVDENGKVTNAQVVGSSHRIFEEAALRAVSKWVFEPGRRGGALVRFRMIVPIQFKLTEDR